MTLLTKQEIEALRDGTTPGPWRIGSWGDNVFGTGPKDEWLAICRVKRDDAPLDESIDGKDARLIAAAPDLAHTALDALARLEDAEAAQALVIERAAEWHDREYARQSDDAKAYHDEGFTDAAALLVSLSHEHTISAAAIRALAPAGAEALAALRAERDGFRRNLREAFEAMCAMRNAINEHVPMPSLESDLLQGPETSVFCATVADAVIDRLAAADWLVAALTEAATLAMSDMEVAFKPGTSVIELIRLGTGATLRLRAALASEPRT